MLIKIIPPSFCQLSYRILPISIPTSVPYYHRTLMEIIRSCCFPFSKRAHQKLFFQTYTIYQQRSYTHYSLITTCFSYVLLPKFTSIAAEYFKRTLLWIIQKSQDLHLHALIRNYLSISIIYFNRTLFINIPSLCDLPSHHSEHTLLLSQPNKFKSPL